MAEEDKVQGAGEGFREPQITQPSLIHSQSVVEHMVDFDQNGLSEKDGAKLQGRKSQQIHTGQDAWENIVVPEEMTRTQSNVQNTRSTSSSIQQQMNAVRTKRASSILFSKNKSKLTLNKQEKEFLWGYVKSYSESQEFILYCGTAFHKQLWLRASGALAQKEANPGYYSTLKSLAAQYPSPCFHQIEIDAERSYAQITNEAHRKEQQNRLVDVLTAFVKRNQKVGYFQGMNFITSQLLLCLTEEEAFWTLCQIIEVYFPLDYFSGFYGVLVDQKVFDAFMQRRYPELAMHFDDIDFNTDLLTFPWFVQIFVNKIPLETVLVVWDLFFLKGVRVLLRVALTVFQIVQQDCLEFDRFDLVLMHIQEFIMNELDPASLMNNFAQEISRSEFKQMREVFGCQVTEQLKSNISADRKHFVSEDAAQQCFLQNFHAFSGLTDYYERQAAIDPCQSNLDAIKTLKMPIEVVASKLTSLYKCNTQWPFCIYDFTVSNLNPKFVAFRVEQDLTSFVEDNYFNEQMLCDLRIAEMEREREQQRVWVLRSQDLLIQRSHHICTMGEGKRSFAKAFEERYLVRDMAMLADHNNFMSYDIDCEAEAQRKLTQFARYVLQPLNPILTEKLIRHDLLKQSQEDSSENDHQNLSELLQEGGGVASNSSKHNSSAMTSLQRAARRTLINFANMRKSSYNWFEEEKTEENIVGNQSAMLQPKPHLLSSFESNQAGEHRKASMAMSINNEAIGKYDSFFADWDMKDITAKMDTEEKAKLRNKMSVMKNPTGLYRSMQQLAKTQLESVREELGGNGAPDIDFSAHLDFRSSNNDPSRVKEGGDGQQNDLREQIARLQDQRANDQAGSSFAKNRENRISIEDLGTQLDPESDEP